MIAQPAFGKRLRSRRLELKMSQKDLADDFVTPSYISLMEHGNRVPSLDVVIRLAKLLRTTPQDLVGGEIEGLTAGSSGAEAAGLAAQLNVRRLQEYGDLDSARDLLARRLDQLRGQPGADEQFLSVGIQLLGVLQGTGEQEEWLRVAHELRELPLARTDADVRLLLDVELASTLRELGRLSEARQVCEEALAGLSASSAEGSSEHVRLLGILTSILVGLSDFDGAGAAVASMLAMAETNGHVGALGQAHWVASMAYVRMGRLPDAYDELAKAHKTIDMGSMQIREWLRFCRFTASILIEDARDLPAAADWIDVAEKTARLAGMAADLRSARRARGHYELAVGDPEAAAKLFMELLEGDAAADGESVVAYEGLSQALDHQGRTEEAIAWLRKAVNFYEGEANYRKAAEIWRRIDVLQQPDR